MNTLSGAPSIARQKRAVWLAPGETRSYGGAAAPPYQFKVGRTCWSAVDSANASAPL